MPTTDLYGPAITDVIKLLRREPNIDSICRDRAKGILSDPQLNAGATADYLAAEKPHLQERKAWRLLETSQAYMAAERAAFEHRYSEVISSPEYGHAARGVQAAYQIVYAVTCDPEFGGPNVIISSQVMQAVLRQVYQLEFSLRYMTSIWRTLVEKDFCRVTPGRAYGGSTVYHLLPEQHSLFNSPPSDGDRAIEQGQADPVLVAQIRMAFREAVSARHRVNQAAKLAPVQTSGRTAESTPSREQAEL